MGISASNRFVLARYLLALLMFVAVGCGGGTPDDKPNLFPVKGKVLLDGKTLANANVQFAPAQNGAPSNGTTDAEGNFTLTYSTGEPGAAPGQHSVIVTTGPTAEEQAALDAAAEGKGDPPKKVTPTKTYTESANVTESENNNITIELKSK